MGIQSRFGKKKSGEKTQAEKIDSVENFDGNVDPNNYDISDDVLGEQLRPYYQAAEEILNDENSSPKIAATSMKLIEIQLKNSRLVKARYQSLEAKNQVASFSQSIREHCDRLFSKLSPSENTEVNKVVSFSKQLIDETYYVSNYEIANNLREAKTRYTELKNRNSLGITIVQAGLFILFLVFVLMILFPMEEDPGFLAIGSVVGAVVMFAVFIGVFFWQKKLSFSKSNRYIRKYEGSIDFERFNQLDQLYDGNYEQAELLRDQHQKVVDQFFSQASAHSDGREVVEESSSTSHDIPLAQPIQGKKEATLTDPLQSENDRPVPPVASPEMKPVPQKPIQSATEVEAEKTDHQERFTTQPSQPVKPTAPNQQILSSLPGKQEAEKKPVISFCMMCGTKVKENAVFCPNCGSKLEI